MPSDRNKIALSCDAWGNKRLKQAQSSAKTSKHLFFRKKIDSVAPP